MKRLLALLALVVVSVLAAFVIGMRTSYPPVVDAVRRMNKSVINPRQLRTAGTPGAYAAVIHHVGRSSGRRYRTPVGAYATGDAFVVVLPYGTRPDWIRNVLAAGSAELDHDGRHHRVDRPEVVPIDASPYRFSAPEQRTHRLFGVTRCLVLHRVEAPSGG